MKKFISTFLTLVLTALAFTINVNAETLTYKDYEYRVINNKYVELVRCRNISRENINADGWYEIPSEINGMEVKYIGDSCFSYDLEVYNLDKVVIPDTVVYIGNYAFKRPNYDGGSLSELSWINEIKLPENIVFIGSSAFIQCDFKEITIPQSVKYLGDSAFAACAKLEKLSIKSELKNIYNATFETCLNLKTVELPESLKSIGDYAFYNCSSLKLLTIPYDVELGKDSVGYYSKNGVKKKISGFTLNIKSSDKLRSYPTKTRLNVVYVLNPSDADYNNFSDSDYYDFKCEVGAEFKVKFVGGSIVNCTSSSPKTVKASKNGKITMLKGGNSDVKVTLKSGKKFTLNVNDDDMNGYPRLEKKNSKGRYVKAKAISVKKKKSVSVKLRGKAYSINNVYTNTKKAKITSKKSAETIKIKGLKKGTATLKIKVNGVKTLKIKVSVS